MTALRRRVAESGAAAAHWPFLVVLGLAALVRVGATIAYYPALFYTDSWSYLVMALEKTSVALAPSRPSGYPLALKLLSLDGHALQLIAPLQHLAGLAIGVLLYVLLIRLEVPRWLATLAAALVLLDGHAIALEQHLMAETLSTLALVLAVLLVVLVRPSKRVLVASGLLLAIAILMRAAVLFAVPAWLIYVIWAHYRQRLAVTLGIAAMALPLLLYAAAHGAAGKGFGLTEADGWFLYGRAAPIANCSRMDLPAGTRPLCDTSGPPKAAFYVWSSRSPAYRLFGGGPGHGDGLRSNRLLKRFAVAAIKAEPGDYARAVGDDLVAYLDASKGTEASVEFPDRPRTALTAYGRAARQRYFPSYEARVRWPSGLLNAYAGPAEIRGWMVAPFALVALVLLVVAALGRKARIRLHGRESFLLLGIGLALLVGAAATSGYIFRYFIPTVPFVVGAGALALSDLLRLRRPSSR